MKHELIMENWRKFLKEDKGENDQSDCDPRYANCGDDSAGEDPKLMSPDPRGQFADLETPENYNQEVFFRYDEWLEMHGKKNDPDAKGAGKGRYPIFPTKKDSNNEWPELWVVRYGKLQGLDDDFENAPAICTRETGLKFIKMIETLNSDPMFNDPINLKFNKYSHSRPSFDEWGSGTSRSRKGGVEIKGANQHKAGNAFDIAIPKEMQKYNKSSVAKKMEWLEKVVDAATGAGFTRFGFGLANIHIDTKNSSAADFMWVYAEKMIFSLDLLNYSLSTPKEPKNDFEAKRKDKVDLVKKNKRYKNYIPYLSDGLRSLVKNKYQKKAFDMAKKDQAKIYKLNDKVQQALASDAASETVKIKKK